ncbi:hypothetical protein [Aneurinibacillus terranovensis]|uniref:hypothetical protein n=1 Tax=Aneurinibacillus terranovensis TaxID=278991 RepID=UPI00040DD881
MIGFKIVLDHLNEPIDLIVYCLSYSLGILIGVQIEERLSLGHVTVQAVTKEHGPFLVQRLRGKGYMYP